MPAIAPLVLKDGAAVPVDRTYDPTTTNGKKADWGDRSAAVPAGERTLSFEVRRPTSPQGAERILMGMDYPTVEVVNGVNTVTRYSSAKIEINFATLSTIQERKDLLAILTNYLLNATVKDAITNRVPFY